MILKNLEIRRDKSVLLPKLKIKNSFKAGDIVLCRIEMEKFYAKIYRQGRAIYFNIPKKSRINIFKINKISIQKVEALNKIKKEYRNGNLLYVNLFINNFRDWNIFENKKKIDILYFRKGTRPTPITSNKVIELNENFFEFLGLLQGEMLKYNKNRKGGGFIFSFSNSDTLIINTIIENLYEYFDIHKDKLIFELRLKNKEDLENNQNIINKWEKELSIGKIHKIYFYNNLNGNSGLLSVQYGSKILAELLNLLLDNIQSLFSERKQIEGFLRGLAAADGSVHRKTNSGTIDSFQIAIKNKDKRDCVKKLFQKLEIENFYVSDGYIRISGFENFIKLAQIDIFKLHLERKARFAELFKKSQKFKTISQLMNFKKGFTIKEYMLKTGAKNYPPVYNKLMNYVDKGLLEVTGEGTRASQLIFLNSNYTKEKFKALASIQ